MVHTETIVKVNAPVDEGIAELVAALSEIEGLITLESCQGEIGGPDAFVIFRLGDWRKSGEFLFDKLLAAMPNDLRSSVSLKLQAYDTDNAIGSICLDPKAVPLLCRCLYEILAPAVRPRVLVTRDTHRETVAQGIAAASGN